MQFIHKKKYTNFLFTILVYFMVRGSIKWDLCWIFNHRSQASLLSLHSRHLSLFVVFRYFFLLGPGFAHEPVLFHPFEKLETVSLHVRKTPDPAHVKSMDLAGRFRVFSTTPDGSHTTHRERLGIDILAKESIVSEPSSIFSFIDADIFFF